MPGRRSVDETLRRVWTASFLARTRNVPIQIFQRHAMVEVDDLRLHRNLPAARNSTTPYDRVALPMAKMHCQWPRCIANGHDAQTWMLPSPKIGHLNCENKTTQKEVYFEQRLQGGHEKQSRWRICLRCSQPHFAALNTRYAQIWEGDEAPIALLFTSLGELVYELGS